MSLYFFFHPFLALSLSPPPPHTHTYTHTKWRLSSFIHLFLPSCTLSGNRNQVFYFFQFIYIGLIIAIKSFHSTMEVKKRAYNYGKINYFFPRICFMIVLQAYHKALKSGNAKQGLERNHLHRNKCLKNIYSYILIL